VAVSKKNLKNGSGRLLYYRIEKTGEQIPKTRTVRGKEQHYLEDETTKIYYEEDEIRNLSLEVFGQSIPFEPGNKTILDNYLLDFWQRFLGFEATMTYINILRYAIAKDYSFPSLETLAMKMMTSIPTLNKYIRTLEEHHFAYRFWVQNPAKNNMNEGVIVKVRKQIPFLSEEQIASLPPYLQDRHDTYLQELMDSYEITLSEKHDYSEEFEKFRSKGRETEPIRRTSLTNPEQYNKSRELAILSKQSEQDIAVWDGVLTCLSRLLSRPSLETWFQGSVAHLRGDRLTVYAKHPMAADWIRTRYLDFIRKAYKETQGTDIHIIEIDSLYLSTPQGNQE
jgi:hypothetical protein